MRRGKAGRKNSDFMIRLVVIVAGLWIVVAESQARDWTLADGSQIQGEIESWGAKGGPGDLAIKNQRGEIKEYLLSDFSQADQAYLQTQRVPWKQTEQMNRFALLGTDLFNLDTGAVVAKNWMGWRENTCLRPVAGGMDDMFFGQNNQHEVTHLGFAIPSRISLNRPYTFKSELLGQPLEGDSLATK